MNGHVTRWLTAYLHGELAPHLRERVSRHVRECDECYAALRREQELARELGDSMPVFGAPRNEQLARVLSGILAEAGNHQGMAAFRVPRAGVALLLSLLLVLLPALVMPRAAVSAPDQPAPYMIAATATQSSTDAPTGLVIALPTAIAARQPLPTEPPAFNPSPVPVVGDALPY
ncbi:MAG: hypothetical protein HPY64_15195 [Anaerolineae bacterium]|nr:hypothetical protein [Anaerolineae bacterium]